MYGKTWWTMMGACAAAALYFAATPPAQAQTVGLHLASWHSEPGYNNTNPGVYVRSEAGWTAGTYRNSIRRQSAYAGWTGGGQLIPGVRAEVTLGVITGYEAAPVLPMAVPSLRIGSEALAARLVLIPKIDPKRGTHVASLAVEWRL